MTHSSRTNNSASTKANTNASRNVEETFRITRNSGQLVTKGNAPNIDLVVNRSSCRTTRSRQQQTTSTQSLPSTCTTKKKTTNNSHNSAISSNTKHDTRKRLTAVTDETKQGKVKRPRIASEAPSRRYNLRSCYAQTTTASRSKPLNAVTPSTVVRQINFVASNYMLYSDSIGLAIPAIPADVIDIFSKPKSYLEKICRCPTHMSQSAPAHVKITDLAALHIDEYSTECTALLREQECREQTENLSLLNLSVPKPRADSSLSSSSTSPSNNMGMLDESTESDSDNSIDNSSTPSTPRPGTILKYSLRGLSTPLVLPSSSISETEPLSCQPYITPKMRSILVNWLVEVAQEYKVSDEAFHLSISIVDAVLSKGYPSATTEYDSDEDSCDSFHEKSTENVFLIRRSDFQALGCSCLWIASKLQDKNPPCVDDFVYISDYSFTTDKLRKFEARVCKVLGFRFQRVSPFLFLNHFLKASHACISGSYCHFDNTTLRILTSYILELSRLTIELTVQKPSLVAAASLYLARVTLGLRETNHKKMFEGNCYWTKTLAYYTGYTVSDLKEIVLTIHKYQSTAEESETLKASYVKFKSSVFRSVSLKTVPLVERLGFRVDDDDE